MWENFAGKWDQKFFGEVDFGGREVGWQSGGRQEGLHKRKKKIQMHIQMCHFILKLTLIEKKRK